MAAEPPRAQRPVSLRGLASTALVAATALAIVAAAIASVNAPVRAVRAKPPAHPPAFRLGPDGVVSEAMVRENSRQGTTSWMIPRGAGTGIEGFAGTTDAVRGEIVGVYVSTPSRRFRVVAYRMGYYGGAGAREVWASRSYPGRVQPRCPVRLSTNTVSCANWSRSLAIAITRAFVPGDYVLKLVGTGGHQNYVLLTVSDPASQAAYLVVNRSFTEAGWNTFGGYSFYAGQGPCRYAETYPVCNRARVLSFDRPYADGQGAADFFGEEYPLVRFMEQHGLDAAYVTDVELTLEPGLVSHHRAILSLGHDESWTYGERLAIQNAERHGVNVAFLGAASIVRHVRLAPSPLGAARLVVDYRDSAEDPLNGHGSPMQVTGNTWLSPPTDWSPVPFVGEEYAGYLDPGRTAPFVVADASAWVFRHTGLRDGSQLPGVIASDIDHLGGPAAPGVNLQVLGHSPISLAAAFTGMGQWNGLTYSDMTYYTDPSSRAGVLDTGDNNWIDSLSPCHPAPAAGCAAPEVARITGNILWLFGQGPAGRLVASVSNARSISPPGS
jgi:hypothetical protein